ncbi:MAG: serine hydrolase domain-containing protein [Burkholderiaceae bacterium]
MGKANLNAIDAMLDYHQRSRHYPGALVLIEQDGKVLCRRVSGQLHGDRQDGPSDPMHDGARFRIASLTKGMVSLVALRLVNAGQLDLDAPVGSVLPKLADMRLLDGKPPSRPPSLRDCLRHTAGFGNLGEITDPQVRRACAEVPLEGDLALLTRDEFLSRLSRRPLTERPGARFQYGFSTDVAGLMIEQVTGQSLQASLKELLFEPLGMTHSSFRVEPSEHGDMPTAFAEDKLWHGFVARFNEADARAAAEQTNINTCTGLLHSGGGGLVSTLDDVARYARLIAAGGKNPNTAAASGKAEQLISEALFNEAMSNQLGPGAPGPYNFTGGGFGFGLAGAIRNDWAPAAIPSATGEFAWSGVTGQTLFIQPGKGWFGLMLSSNTASRVIVRLEFRRAAAGVS